MAGPKVVGFGKFRLCDFDKSIIPQNKAMDMFVVLELKRYYPEPTFRSRYGTDTDNCEFWDAFDITVCDKHHKRKLVLTADARLKKKIYEGSYIRIMKFVRYWDEYSVQREAVVIIQDLDICHGPHIEISELKKLPWTSPVHTKQRDNVPLGSARCYYVDLWTFNLLPHQDFGAVKHCNINTIDVNDVHYIHEVVRKKISQYSEPTLLVKVMRRYRLIHYVAQSKEDKWPFQLPLMVADKNGHCSAVLWNRLGPQFYDHIKEGSILLLKNFRVKPSLQQKMKTFLPPPQGSVIYASELSMDAHHPSAEIQIVDYATKDDIEHLGFPPLETCFMTRRDLLSVPDPTVVDVAGLVTYVGRIEREARKEFNSQKKDSGAFYYKRWVHLRDTSLDAPIIVLLYCGDQQEAFMNIRTGICLLCRHVLAKQQLEHLQSSRQKRCGWLSTTTNSWLYFFHPGDTGNLPDALADVVNVALPESDAEYEYKEQGFFRYPPFPDTLELELLEKFIPCRQWKAAFDSMTWRECHQLVLHASFVSLTFFCFVKPGSVMRQSPRKRFKTDETQQASSSTDKSKTSTDLGCSEFEEVSHLWPTELNAGKKSKRQCALLMKWQGLSEPVVLNTIKPCGFHTNTEVTSFKDLLTGVYDTHLGLVDCDRTELTGNEEAKLMNSSTSFINSEFVLLVDVYTNEDNRQTVVLNRAFERG